MESHLKTILARTVCPALGLAVLALLPGCASSGSRGTPGEELNPKVTGEAHFTGYKSGPKVIFEIEVEQKEPMIKRPHTWTVRVWTSESNSDLITMTQVAGIMSDLSQACMPDLRAGCEEAEVRYWDCNGRFKAKYTIVVVEVIEMTGGDHPTVYATKTHALAFENGAQSGKEVEIPLCTEANMGVQVSEVEAKPEATDSGHP